MTQCHKVPIMASQGAVSRAAGFSNNMSEGCSKRGWSWHDNTGFIFLEQHWGQKHPHSFLLSDENSEHKHVEFTLLQPGHLLDI